MRRYLDALLGPTTEADEAWARADELLASSLLPEQHATYVAKGYIEVPSRLTPGRVYRVDGWRPVAVYDTGRFAGAVCIRSNEHLPAPDVVLARKLMIEGAEEEFLRSGNWLEPAWRPSGSAPVVAVLLMLIAPWVFHLRTLGTWGVLASVVLLAVPATVWWRGRLRASGSDGRRGTPAAGAG